MATEHRVAHWKGDGSYEIVLDDTELLFRVPVSALNIIWGNDTRFWRLNYTMDQNCGLNIDELKERALLVQVNWIEVTGKLAMKIFRSASSVVKRYEICYVVNFRRDAFGWHSAPIKFKVKVDDAELETEKIINMESYKEKHDEWHEIPGGQFSVSESGEFVEFGMYEVESSWWKGGMVLACVKIKPLKDH